MTVGPEAVIERFYDGFARGDTDAMAACYHEDVRFSDPVFPDLRGPEVMKMWRMLVGRADDLAVTLGRYGADGDTGHAHWSATYTFSKTGRLVNNEIDANFRFADGLIVEHADSFGFWRWSRMALGAPGFLLGWSPLVKGKVRGESARLLERAG